MNIDCIRNNKLEYEKLRSLVLTSHNSSSPDVQNLTVLCSEHYHITKRQLLVLLCDKRDLHMIQVLITHPKFDRYDINHYDQIHGREQTLLHHYVRQQDEQIVALLASYDLGKRDLLTGDTPLILACMTGNEKLVRMLNNKYVNVSNKKCDTPLTWLLKSTHKSTCERYCQKTKLVKIIVSNGHIDHKIHEIGCQSCLEVMLIHYPVKRKRLGSHYKDVISTQLKDDRLNALIAKRNRDPELFRYMMKVKHGYYDHSIGKLFSLIIYHCDGYLSLKTKHNTQWRRFFQITSQLPIELQMLIVNILHGKNSVIIPFTVSELGFNDSKLLTRDR